MTAITCGGQCCAVFHQQPDRHLEPETGDRDHDYITDMLVPLDAGEANQRARRYGMNLTERIGGDWQGNEGTFYTCRHFDGRLCTAYAERPQMCSEYPYDGDCFACSYTADADTRRRWWAARRWWVVAKWANARKGAA